MKKIVVMCSVVLCLILCSGFVCALSESIMELHLTGTKEISPNAFELTYFVETSNVDAQKAVNENKENSDSLYKALNALIDKKRGDFIKTSNYSLNPQYEYKNGKSILKSYKVRNNVKVHVKDISAVSKFSDLASTKGVTGVNNLIFQATDYDDKCNELISELAGKAKKRANTTLKPLDMHVLTVKSISTSCSQTSSYPVVNYSKSIRALGANVSMADTAEESTSTPIETGKMILNASLNTVFYIGVKK